MAQRPVRVAPGSVVRVGVQTQPQALHLSYSASSFV
jgi:hypothetical protein